jgi:4-diphosphocytidyl-2-C-methyl-D-erythritol kinase
MLTVHAPAKVNLVLEVVGRGSKYHDICSIAQTIDLCDILTFDPASEISFTCSQPALLDDNIVPRTARLLQERCHVTDGAHIHLEKHIPWAAGLGGGSSDAAATLLGLNRLWGTGLSPDRLVALGAEIGSDVPLFLPGGTVHIEGRGDRVRSLPNHPEMHAVIVAPGIAAPSGKTGLVYSRLRAEMFTTGQFVRAATYALEQGKRIPEDLMFNVFEKVADEVFAGLAQERQQLESSTPIRWHLAGSGPCLYALLDSEAEARKTATALHRPGRMVFTARTLNSADAEPRQS